jgi:hypothetical protein
VTNLGASPIVTPWSGVFDLPSGSTSIFDCGFFEDSQNRIAFSIQDIDYPDTSPVSTAPLWTIGAGETAAIPLSTVFWFDASSHPEGMHNLNLARGIDVYAPSVGIEDTPDNPSSALSASMNPFSSSVAISGPSDASIQIFDILGRTILEDAFAENYVWDAADEAPGVYHVRVRDSEGISRLVLVKL